MRATTWNPYEVRNETLKRMGFNSYREYLESPLWKSIRAKVLARDRCKCLKCGQEAREVHHKSYERGVLLGWASKRRHLISLCRACHEGAEFCDGRKTKLSEANARCGMPGMVECVQCKTMRAWTDFTHSRKAIKPTRDKCKKCRRKRGRAYAHP
jgi:hypothetical protein